MITVSHIRHEQSALYKKSAMFRARGPRAKSVAPESVNWARVAASGKAGLTFDTSVESEITPSEIYKEETDQPIRPQDSVVFRPSGLQQTTDRESTLFSLVQGPTRLRKNADVYPSMIKSDPTTLTAFGIGVGANAFAYLSISVRLVGISMLDPYRNRNVVARDITFDRLIEHNKRMNKVHTVCISVAIDKTGTLYRKWVKIKRREEAMTFNKKTRKEKEEEHDDEIDTGETAKIRSYFSGGKEEAEEDKKLPPPILLYRATNLVLMDKNFSDRVWYALGFIAPQLVHLAETTAIPTEILTEEEDPFLPLRIDCCGVANDIMLTLQDHSEQHPTGSANGKLYDMTLELIENFGLACTIIDPKTLEFGRSLTQLLYLYGRKIDE